MKRASRKTPYRILTLDPLLKPYAADVALRMERNAAVRKQLLGDSAALSAFANGYLYYGFHRTQAGWVFREWAPGADAIHLIGDFNDWNRASHPLRRLDGGVWEIELSGADALKHGQHVKLQITRGGRSFDRIPAYIRYTVQDPLTHQLTGVIWAPERPFQWTDGGYGRKKISPLMIYEAHIGMAQEREGIGTYREFADFNLERIKSLGYNAVQLMAVMEHPYYASFGYQISNFFAVSSRLGTPEDLKALLDYCADALVWNYEKQMGAAGDVYGGVVTGFGEWLPGRSLGHVSEDTTTMISLEQFEEFGRPRTERIFRKFDEVFIHMHALSERCLASVASLPNIRLMELSSDPNTDRAVEVWKRSREKLTRVIPVLRLTRAEIESNMDLLKSQKTVVWYDAACMEDAQDMCALFARELPVR